MAREVLSNGVIVPEKYTRDWFDDFRTNLVKLNDAITAIAGKQNALTQEQLDAVNSAITSQKVTAYDDHIADTSKHLTDGTASKAIADEDGTSIKTGYVNVAGNQTVSGDKSFTGSNTFNSILPNATNAYSLGTSSYQWSSVYAQTYYYNGTAWGLDKANTWSGNNYFTRDLVINSDAAANAQSALSGSKIRQIVFNNSDNSNYFFRLRQYIDATSSRMQFNAQGFDSNNQAYSATFVYRVSSDGDAVLYPGDNNQSLGTSTNKWKTLNGINPGALSLPTRGYNDSISLDTTNWSYDGNGFTISMTDNNGDYIPGWVVIVAEDVGDASDFIKIRTTQYTRSPGLDFATFYTGSQYSIKACFPATGIIYLVLKLTNGASCIKYARYYPCLGNV